MARPRTYPDELRERGVQLVFEGERPIAQVARDLGIYKETLCLWVR
jgi:transposase-like protein